jgi:hypothetical protein
MVPEENQLLSRRSCEEVFKNENPAANDECGAGSWQEALAKKIFVLALALATEPSKLADVRQMLVQLQDQQEIPEVFSTWAMGQIDERVRSMALAYAHDAEVLVQLLSFQGGTFDGLVQAIEDLYQHEQISQRVYVKARLLLRTAGHQEAPS